MVARSREMASAAGAPAALAARLPRARGCRGARRGVRRVRVSVESPEGREELSRPSPPEKFMRFEVRKTLRVPVPEPARVNEAAGRAPRSLERWIQRPENVMEVVFSKEGVIPQESGEWRISVIKLPFLDWELNPEFDLRVLPKDAAAREFGVRMVSDALRFAPEGGLEKLPPGFAGMDIWSYIDCELFIERLADDDGGRRRRGEVAHGGVRGHRPAHRGGHPRRVSMDTVLRGDRRERHRGQHRERGRVCAGQRSGCVRAVGRRG